MKTDQLTDGDRQKAFHVLVQAHWKPGAGKGRQACSPIAGTLKKEAFNLKQVPRGI